MNESLCQFLHGFRCFLVMRSLPPSLGRFVICKVLVCTYEGTRLRDSDDYFAKKFAPLAPLYVMSRSYAKEPKCGEGETLFDCWKDRFVFKPSTDHNIINLHALSVIVVCIDMDL